MPAIEDAVHAIISDVTRARQRKVAVPMTEEQHRKVHEVFDEVRALCGDELGVRLGGTSTHSAVVVEGYRIGHDTVDALYMIATKGGLRVNIAATESVVGGTGVVQGRVVLMIAPETEFVESPPDDEPLH